MDRRKAEEEAHRKARLALGSELVVESELKLKVSEKDQLIQSLQRQIEELIRKAEQGWQQLQGEVQELELESLLGSAFVFDKPDPTVQTVGYCQTSA
jgi:hypothetical protein